MIVQFDPPAIVPRQTADTRLGQPPCTALFLLAAPISCTAARRLQCTITRSDGRTHHGPSAATRRAPREPRPRLRDGWRRHPRLGARPRGRSPFRKENGRRVSFNDKSLVSVREIEAREEPPEPEIKAIPKGTSKVRHSAPQPLRRRPHRCIARRLGARGRDGASRRSSRCCDGKTRRRRTRSRRAREPRARRRWVKCPASVLHPLAACGCRVFGRHDSLEGPNNSERFFQ